jgi:glycosyltransferase involved in cell wall biosynthesis
LQLAPGDSVVVVDNTQHESTRHLAEGQSRDAGRVRLLRASRIATPAFARNRGAASGSAEWIVFIDADAAPGPDLLDQYFAREPGTRTALIAGGILDEEVPPDGPLAARYAYLRGAMRQQDTFNFGEWGYPKTANVACRRTAFEAVGGFTDEIRAAEDADLTYRLRAAGWEVERREQAAVVHFSRQTTWGLLKQKALWGAGGAWLERKYPGSIELARGRGAIRWGASSTLREVRRAARERTRDALIYALLRPLEAIAYEAGRLISNERRLSKLRPHGRADSVASVDEQ